MKSIKIIIALLGTALLFAACEKETEKAVLEDSRLLLGSWKSEGYWVMSFYESGVAEFYFGSVCFGVTPTSYLNWILTDKGHQVHFTVNGESSPKIKWELRKVTPDTLWVKESLEGFFSDTIINTFDQTYIRIHRIDVNPDDLTGRWVVEGTQEFWHFRNGGTGVTWDESEDISEEESDLQFEWTLNRDELTCVWRDENENRTVPKVYRICEITTSSMKWENIFGQTTKLKKI